MMHTFPYGIDSWLPVLRGLEAPMLFVDAADPLATSRLEGAWSKAENGARVVLRSVASPGQKPKLAHLEKELESTGYVERFLVFPGTGGSFTLLPKVDGAALRGGMALLPNGRAKGRALWALLRVASPLGVAERIGRPEIAIWTKGTKDQAAHDLAVLPVAGSIAIAAGVPGRNQKIIARALDRRGDARAIVKIGFSERTDDAVRREALALQVIADTLEDRSPELLSEGERAGRAWLAQEPLDGGHAGTEITPHHAEFLIELGTKTRGESALLELPSFQDAVRNLERLDPALDPDWHAEYSGLSQALKSAVDDHPVRTSYAHGDFTPWNVVGKAGRIRAFDWEYFSETAPALSDLLHFHLQSCILVKRHSGERIFDELDAFFRGPAGGVAAALELRAEEILQLVALYVLHEGVALEIQERQSPSPFAQATWLRHARRALCRRLTGLLTERRLPSWATGAAAETRTAHSQQVPSREDAA